MTQSPEPPESSGELPDPDPYDQGGAPAPVPPHQQPGPPGAADEWRYPQAPYGQPGFGAPQPPPPAYPYPQQPQPPYGGPAHPYGGPGGYPAPSMPGQFAMMPRRRRPHLAWWSIPVLTLLAAFVMFVVPLVQVVSSISSPYAQTQSNQRATFALAEATLVGLWVEEGYAADAATCVITNTSGEQIGFSAVDAPMDYEQEISLKHVGQAQVPAGQWTLNCGRSPTPFAVQVGPMVSTPMLAMFMISFVVGFIGLIALIVMTVLAVTGAPRKPFMPTYPGQPGPPGSAGYPGYPGY